MIPVFTYIQTLGAEAYQRLANRASLKTVFREFSDPSTVTCLLHIIKKTLNDIRFFTNVLNQKAFNWALLTHLVHRIPHGL